MAAVMYVTIHWAPSRAGAGQATSCRVITRHVSVSYFPFMFNPYAAGGEFGQYKMMQKS